MAAPILNAHPSAGVVAASGNALVAGERLAFGHRVVRETAEVSSQPPDAPTVPRRTSAERSD
jgi:hypothetical protein